MPIVIVFIVVLVATVSVLLIIRHKRLAEFERKIDFFLGQISVFFKECSDCLQHYVPETEESIIISKWHDLYSEISRHHLSKKHKAFMFKMDPDIPNDDMDFKEMAKRNG